MKRLKKITGSAMGASVRLRMDETTQQALRKHLARPGNDEQFAFALASHARTADGTTMLVRELLMPERKDLDTQSGGGVSPSAAFQALVYERAAQQSASIVDIHTHPFQDRPVLSGIDQHHSARNAEYICSRFPHPVTHAMVVHGRQARSFDAVVYDRSLAGYRDIEAVEVLGRPLQILTASGTPEVSDERYDRQMRIPGWHQRALAAQRIVVVGAGGNGAQLTETLLCLGVATVGWIAAIDPESIEPSNTSRIPYAGPGDAGHPKVTVAARFAGRKNPDVRFYPYPCSVTEKVALERLRAATIIIGAGDGDGIRKVCNEQAVRYAIPYIDLGCDIQAKGKTVEAGGQVRVVLPGRNSCLVCCGGYDPADAAADLVDDATAAVRGQRGYVRGDREQPTASVVSLNAMTAQLGISALLSLVLGDRFGSWDYAHIDQLAMETLTASSQPRADCPLCGPEGVLAAGDPPAAPTAPEPDWSSVAATS